MAVRTDIYTVDASVSPRVCWVDIAHTEANAQDLYDTLKHLEALPQYIDEDPFCDAGGLEPLDDTTKVGITVSLFNMQYAFADRAGPEWVICNMSGGNVVAFTDSDRITTLYPRKATAYVSADRTSASSATSQNQASIEYSSFQGGVWVNQASGTTGTDGLKGNAQFPVNNIPDAIAICAERGLPETLYVIGNLVLDTGDDVSGFVIIGQNATRTTITVNSGANTAGCEVKEAHVTGNLDGGTILRNCVIDSLNYVNGFVYNCMLNPGVISLGGSSTAHFLNCYSGVPGLGTPCIDMNGAGVEDTPLAIRGYNGGICLLQKTGTAATSIDLASGQVIIDSTCVGGTVVVRGDGKVIDENGTLLTSGTINTGLTLVNETTVAPDDTAAIAAAVWNFTA